MPETNADAFRCACYSIRGEMRRADGWLYCGNCGGRIGDGSLPAKTTTTTKET